MSESISKVNPHARPQTCIHPLAFLLLHKLQYQFPRLYNVPHGIGGCSRCIMTVGSERVRWVELMPGPAHPTEHHSTGLLLIISDGFQLLHAVYVVERFLENLVKRHCQFHIAFFEGNSL